MVNKGLCILQTNGATCIILDMFKNAIINLISLEFDLVMLLCEFYFSNM